MTNSRIERILPSLVWLETHLDSELSLEALASAAGLSASHFQRLFKECVGQTPRAYVQRLRLDRAAFLLTVEDRSIAETAFLVGFNNHETFSRAFRRRFGTTPRDYRRARRYSLPESDVHLDGLEGYRNNCELSDTSICQWRPMHVAFIRHVGDYTTVPPTLWDDLLQWFARSGQPGDPPLLGLGHDAPGITPTDRLRFDACVRVESPFAADGFVGCQTIPAGTYAMTTHVGSFDTLTSSWEEVFARVMSLEKYSTTMLPAIELYHAMRLNPASGLNKTDLCLPLVRR